MTALELLELVGDTASAVLLAVTPLGFLFLVFQVLFLKLPPREVSRILIGSLLAAAGLFLFLLGVSLAFLPFGQAIGAWLATLPNVSVVIAFGLALGFVTAWAEPAVRVLAEEVETASSGSIRSAIVLAAICVGVAIAVGMGMLRIRYGIPLAYIVVPGYCVVLVLSLLSDRSFVGIAVDAGGVATGPLANSFLLALALGASAARATDSPMVEGLGLVALIALAPILSVMTLGVVFRRKASPRSS